MPYTGGVTSFTAPRMDEAKAKEEQNNLTDAEKEVAYRELYGLEPPPIEDPAVVEQQLGELDDALKAIQNETCWNTAQERCPEITNDRSFRLLFLRSEYYDVEVGRRSVPACPCARNYWLTAKCVFFVWVRLLSHVVPPPPPPPPTLSLQKAAQRMIKYWKFKQEVFGVDRAYQKIRLSDLGEGDLSMPRKQAFYVLPGRDNAGRAIIFSRKPEWDYQNRKDVMRWVWYSVERAVTEDESLQHAGFLVMGFNDGPFTFKQFDRKLEKKLWYMGECLPIRWTAVHLLFDSKVHEILVPFLRFMMGEKLRARFLIYPGYERHNRLDRLHKVGMSRKVLPTCMGGEDDFDLPAWIEQEKERELRGEDKKTNEQAELEEEEVQEQPVEDVEEKKDEMPKEKSAIVQ